jgi:hypothetical protein
MKPKKLTKKMLKDLNKWELRKLAIIAMDMDVTDAYSKDETELIQWIYSEPDKFIEGDIDSIVDCDRIRPGILDYARGLQSYLRGETKTQPTFSDEPIEDEPVEDEPAQAVLSVVEKPVKKKKSLRKRTKKDAVSEVPIEVVAVEEKEEVEVVPVEVELVEAVSTEEQLAEIRDSMVALKTILNSNLEAVVRNILDLHNKLSMVRTEQTLIAAVQNNAMVYLLNEAVQDEDEEFVTLDQVPKQYQEIQEDPK